MSGTIAALATASGEGALAVIRLSGPDAFRIARSVGALGDRVLSHRAVLRRLTFRGERLDQALVLPFKGPGSFTGEDVVELQVHGGRVTQERVLAAVFALGAQPAEPGEFSRRALLNGKLDLVQVEAIADVIHAQSEAGHRLAQAHLAGNLSATIDALKESLFTVVTLVEAAIDFSLEEHVYSISTAEIINGVTPVLTGVRQLLASYQAGRLRTDGVRVAIVGRPNAGKSSLLNALLREDRAIVTEVAGTTRDTIRETIGIDGVHYHLTDTAGIREAVDQIESLGVARSRAALAECDVALVVVAADDEQGAEELLALAAPKPAGVVVNKIDRGELPQWQTVLAVPHVCVSALHGIGMDQVEPFLSQLAHAAGLGSSSETTLLTRARHRSALESVEEDLERAISAAEGELGHELIAFDLRAGLEHLGALTGAITDDDILNRIFGDFCVGK